MVKKKLVCKTLKSGDKQWVACFGNKTTKPKAKTTTIKRKIKRKKKVKPTAKGVISKSKAKPKVKAPKKLSAGKAVLLTQMGFMAKVGKARKGATTPMTIKALEKWGKVENNWASLYEEEVQFPAENNANETDYYGELKQKRDGSYQQYQAKRGSRKKGIKRLKKILSEKVKEGDLKMKIGGKGITKSLVEYLRNDNSGIVWGYGSLTGDLEMKKY